MGACNSTDRSDEIIRAIRDSRAPAAAPASAVDSNAALIRAQAAAASQEAKRSTVAEPIRIVGVNGVAVATQPAAARSSDTPDWLHPLVASATATAKRRAHVLPQTSLAASVSSSQVKLPGQPMTFAPALVNPALPNTVPRVTGLITATGDATGYSYAYYDGLQSVPGYCASLPTSEWFDFAKLFRLGGDLLQSHIELYYTHYRLNDFDTWVNPQRYVDFFAFGRDRNSGWKGIFDSTFALPLPELSYTWRTDAVWASQFLLGTNPVLIRLVNSINVGPSTGAKAGPIPEGFNLNQDVRDHIKDMTDSTLEDLIAKKRLFAVDHKLLKNCPTIPGRVLYAPISLLYIDGTGTLQPLCIQLRTAENDAAVLANVPSAPPSVQDDRTVYYPDSHHVVWQLAKMLVSQADANYHEAITHLGFCHLLMEPIVIAAHRSFTADNPIYKFLTPHFHRTLWINNNARSTLINVANPKANFSFNDVSTVGVNGALYLINKAYEEFDFMRDCNLPIALRYRGVLEGKSDDPQTILPGYHYRDYGLKVWTCMHSYVEDVVMTVYPTDATVYLDAELQTFVLVALQNGRVKGFPSEVKTRADLVELVTSILFTGSAQHAAVNFPQYDYYAFLPAKPLIMTSGMPSKADDVTWEYVTRALAGQATAMETIILMKALTQQSAQDYHLETEADHPFLSFFDLDAVAYPKQYRAFVGQLKVAEDKMREINDHLGTNYHYLYPSEIPSSVSI